VNNKLLLFIVATTVFLALLWQLDKPLRSANTQSLQTPGKELKNVQTHRPDMSAEGKSQHTTHYTTPSEHDQITAALSLAGTDIDGAITADTNGKLIVNIEVRDFFDYFLNIADEVGVDVAVAEVSRYIETYLPEQARLPALELFENYLRYKGAEFQLHQTPVTQDVLSDGDALTLLRDNFDTLRERRSELFTKDEEIALFSLEDTYAEYTLRSLELLADETVSDEQKRRRLDEMHRSLPPELAGSIAETELARQQQQSLDSLLESDIDDAPLHEQLLQQGYGQQKADEIVSHRQQQHAFQQQYESYREARAKLVSDSPDYQQKINALRAQFFASAEQRTQARLRDLNNN